MNDSVRNVIPYCFLRPYDISSLSISNRGDLIILNSPKSHSKIQNEIYLYVCTRLKWDKLKLYSFSEPSFGMIAINFFQELVMFKIDERLYNSAGFNFLISVPDSKRLSLTLRQLKWETYMYQWFILISVYSRKRFVEYFQCTIHCGFTSD